MKVYFGAFLELGGEGCHLEVAAINNTQLNTT